MTAHSHVYLEEKPQCKLYFSYLSWGKLYISFADLEKQKETGTSYCLMVSLSTCDLQAGRAQG